MRIDQGLIPISALDSSPRGFSKYLYYNRASISPKSKFQKGRKTKNLVYQSNGSFILAEIGEAAEEEVIHLELYYARSDKNKQKQIRNKQNITLKC